MSVAAIRDGKIQEVDDNDFDVEFVSPNQFLSTHVNQIPLQNAVSAPRLFYGARFYNQAVPLINPETPLVQNLVDGTDQSFDELLGEQMGAVRAKGAGTVRKITPDFIEVEDAETKEVRKVNLYNNMPFNRKTMITNTPMVQEGDTIEPGQLLAKSNYTDDQGRVAMGVNARIGLVPYKGHSMDDAVVISESFAKRLTSQQAYSDEIDLSDGTKGGVKHFISLFPTEYTKEQLANFDENGVVKPGTVLNPGDPYILATKPRMITSNMGAVGKLSRAMANTRQNASRVWDHEDPAEVVDVAQTRKGFKVIVKSETPAKVGDKMVERHGQKGIISKIIPDSQMPRTTDGEPLEVLLNPMGIPSRVNDATPLDMLLGKVAKKRGEPFRLGAFNKKGESWVDFVERTLAENEMSDVEEVFDPSEQRKLENPITVGYGHILKLHHMGESKVSSRSQGAYDCYSSDTEVLTDKGWVFWPAVTEEHKLYTPDLKTHTASYEYPRRLVSYDFDGDLLHYSSRKLDFMVTENHKCPSATPKVSEWRDRTAQKLMSLRMAYVPKFGFQLSAKDPKTKTIPHVPDSRKRNKYEGDLVIDFHDYVKLSAWWASEGSIDDEGRLIIWQAKKVHPKEYEEIRDLLVRITGVEPWDFYGRGWRVQDPRLGAYFKQHGIQDHNKRVPQDILEAGPYSSWLFIETFVKGDGTFGQYQKEGRLKLNEVMCVCSCSLQLMEGLQILAVHAGKGMHYEKAKPKGSDYCIDGRSGTTKVDNYEGWLYLCNSRGQVVGGALGEADKRYKGSWSKVPYSGKVYCATTKTGYLLVRRNGKVCVSGNSDQQPLKGGSEAAQAKRLSTLELGALLSSGAYATMREGATLRGQQNDDYWRAIRQGQTPKEPGEPFAWEKFKALLTGSGLYARNLGDGRLRLGPFTDRELAKRNPARIERGGLVDPVSLEPEPGGLFDPALVGNNRWGKIELNSDVPNPAFEKQIALLLGVKQKDVERLVAGEVTLEELRDQ